MPAQIPVITPQPVAGPSNQFDVELATTVPVKSNKSDTELWGDDDNDTACVQAQEEFENQGKQINLK